MKNLFLILISVARLAFSAGEVPSTTKTNQLEWAFSMGIGEARWVVNTNPGSEVEAESPTWHLGLKVHYWHLGLELEGSDNHAVVTSSSTSIRNGISNNTYHLFWDHPLKFSDSFKIIPRLGFGLLRFTYEDRGRITDENHWITQNGYHSILGLDFEMENVAIGLDYIVSLSLQGRAAKTLSEIYAEDKKGSMNRYRATLLFRVASQTWLGMQFIRTNFMSLDFVGKRDQYLLTTRVIF